MEHPENTPEQIRDFLKGRLPAEEAAAFRQRMADNPALEEEVAFAHLLMGGLEELSRQKKKQRWKTESVILLVLFGVGIVIYLYAKYIIKPDALIEPTIVIDTVAQAGGASSKFNSDRPVALAFNRSGEIILGGIFLDSTRLGSFTLPGSDEFNIFLAACSSDSLHFHWAQSFGSQTGADFLTKITIGNGDSIIITGAVSDSTRFGNRIIRTIGRDNGGKTDFFIAKLDPSGNLVWIDHSGGTMIPNKQTGANFGSSVVVDQFDNVIATGTYIGSPKLSGVSLPVGGPNEDMYLAKYAPDGRLRWVKSATSDNLISAFGIDTDKSGNIFLTGFFGHQTMGGSAVFGGKKITSYGGRDIFIAKYRPDGTLDWVRQAGSPLNDDGKDCGQSIAADEKGDCVVTGWFKGEAKFDRTTLISQGDRDIFLAKYSRDGVLKWSQSFGGTGRDHSYAVCFDRDGNVYCTGFFTGTARFGTFERVSNGTEDAFVLKCDSNGKLLWIRQMGGNQLKWNADGAHDISIDDKGRLVVTGFFSGTMDIDGRLLTSAGREDIFLLFFDTQKGVVQDVKQLAPLQAARTRLPARQNAH